MPLSLRTVQPTSRFAHCSVYRPRTCISSRGISRPFWRLSRLFAGLVRTALVKLKTLTTVASEQIADGVYRCKRVVRAQCNDEIAVARIRLERVGWIANAADFAAYKKLRNRTERAVLTIQTRHNGTLLQVYKTLMSALDAEFWECDGVNCNL